MSSTQTCPFGHAWDKADQPCPICAAEDRAVFDTDADDLPPPPRTEIGGATWGNSADAVVSSRPHRPLALPGYEILSEIGRGGMGVVYRARHVRLRRIVALKMILAGAHADPRDRSRFQAEAEAVARLQHSNIVQIYEIGEHDGQPFVALEYIDGGSLAQQLAGSPPAAHTAAELIEALARAVHYAHEQGILHRDLKPANVLLKDNCGRLKEDRDLLSKAHASLPLSYYVQPKITDFGLAKRLDDASQTRTGEVMGTPSYMAPEQALGDPAAVGPGVDVYALGAILYECLTGRPPFKAANATETLRQLNAHEPVPPSRLQPRVPRDLETICLACLRKDPAKRYASAAALADDLMRFRLGMPIHARRTPIWERMRKWTLRHPAAAALMVLAAGAAFAVAALAAWHLRTLANHNRDLQTAAVKLAEERDAADRARQDADRLRERAEDSLEVATLAVNQMLVRIGIDELRNTPGMDPARAALLEDALRFFHRLIREQGDIARFRPLQIIVHERAGSIQMHLGRFDAARQHFENAKRLLEEKRQENDLTLDDELFEALVVANQARLLVREGKTAEALKKHQSTLEMLEELEKMHPYHVDVRTALAAAYVDAAMIARAENVRDWVELYLGRAKSRAERLVAGDSSNLRYQYILGLTLNDLAVLEMDADNMPEAMALLKRAVEIWRRRLRHSPENSEIQMELARGLNNLGIGWRLQGHRQKAEEHSREALTIRQHLVHKHPHVRLFELDLCRTFATLANIARDRGDHDAALSWYGQAFHRLAGDPPRAPTDFQGRQILQDILVQRGDLHDKLGRHGEAASDLGRALQLTPPDDQPRLRMYRGLMLARTGKLNEGIGEARPLLKEESCTAEMFFTAARIFAVAAKDESDGKSAEQHAVEAMTLLKQAHANRFFTEKGAVQLLVKHADFEKLRVRKDFSAFLEQVSRP